MNALVTLLPLARGNQQRESREPTRCNNPPESRVTLRLALRTLRGIRQRYESERTAHPDSRVYCVHVALDDSDMLWIAATIEALERQQQHLSATAAGSARGSHGASYRG